MSPNLNVFSEHLAARIRWDSFQYGVDYDGVGYEQVNWRNFTLGFGPRTGRDVAYLWQTDAPEYGHDQPELLRRAGIEVWAGLCMTPFHLPPGFRRAAAYLDSPDGQWYQKTAAEHRVAFLVADQRIVLLHVENLVALAANRFDPHLPVDLQAELLHHDH